MRIEFIKKNIIISFVILSVIFSCTQKSSENGIDRIKSLYYNGRYDRARLALDSILGENGEDSSIDLLILSTDIDIKLGLYQSASNTLDTILFYDSSLIDTVLVRYRQIVDKLSFEGRYSEEVIFSQKVFSIDLESVEKNILIDVVRKFLNQGDTVSAIKGLLYSYGKDNNALNACFILSAIFREKGDKETSLEWIDSALILPEANRVEVTLEKARLLLEIAKEYLDERKTHKAMTYLTESSYLTNSTISAEASWLAGSLLVNYGKYYQSSIFLERVLELERSSALRDKAINLLIRIQE